MIDFSLIVPVFNGTNFIADFIESLGSPPDNVEIIFVDNGSTDGSVDLLTQLTKNFPESGIYQFSRLQSSYAARNYGATHAKGSVFVFTDIDCIFTSDYFRALKRIPVDSYILMSGPTNIFTVTDNIYEHFDKQTYLLQSSYAEKKYAATANLIVGRELFRNVGGFAEFTSGADNKFCSDCFENGGRLVFNKNLQVLHPPRASLREHLIKAERLGIGHGQKLVSELCGHYELISAIGFQFLSLLIPFHGARLFLRVFRAKAWHFSDLVRLAVLCVLVVSIQRIKILTILLKNLTP